MKRAGKIFHGCLGGWMLAGLLFTMVAAGVVRAESSTFTFILDESCQTSAGVYASDGTLLLTLWSKVRYPAGTNVAVWDGLDDNSNAMPAGVYQIRLLEHNFKQCILRAGLLQVTKLVPTVWPAWRIHCS
jgi:flagellar hook assembly protein FlgD